MSRFIGIRHRVKKTAAGEARPTEVVILERDGTATSYNLETEEEELDFLMGRFVARWRPAKPNEDVSHFFGRHVKTRKKRGSKTETETVVPDAYIGYQSGDTVGMMLGGSGDDFAFALSRHGEEIGGRVFRIPPGALADHRAREKSEDARTLAELVRDQQELFYPTTVRDRKIIELRGRLNARLDSMKDRIACEQRLRQRMIGEIFRNTDGFYPEGAIEDIYREKRASDARLQAILDDEGECNRALLEALEDLNIYTSLLGLVEGMGPAIASRIIALIGDIHRFPTTAKFKAYLGVHCTPDGRFPRRRRGERANWNEELGRKAFFLLGDQFNKRPKSVWGQKLLDYKRKLREKHPVIECSACGVTWELCCYAVHGKAPAPGLETTKLEFPGLTPENLQKKFHTRRYTDGHILKMALWRTRTKFAEWLWREWQKLEGAEKTAAKAA